MVYGYKVVCLCGSTKFKEEFLLHSKLETLAGNIVLSVGFFGHADNEKLDMKTKIKLDIMHFAKIDMADEILVINVDDYIGESTLREIYYAKSKDKRIRYIHGGNKR